MRHPDRSPASSRSRLALWAAALLAVCSTAADADPTPTTPGETLVQQWIRQLEQDPPVLMPPGSVTGPPQCLAHAHEDVVPLADALVKSVERGAEPTLAVRLLGGLGPQAVSRTVPSLLRLLDHPDTKTRLEALRMLATTDVDRGLLARALVRLADETWEGPELLQAVRPPGVDVTSELTRVLRESKSALHRYSTALALGAVGAEAAPAVPQLLSQLDTAPGDSEVTADGERAGAADALGRIGADPDRVLPRLVAALRSPSWRLRDNAVRALGYYGRRAAPVLADARRLRRDPDRRVRDTAKWVVRAIEGRPEKRAATLGDLFGQLTGICSSPPDGFPKEGLPGGDPLISASGDALVVGPSYISDAIVFKPGEAVTYRAPDWKRQEHRFENVLGPLGEVALAWDGSRFWAGAARWGTGPVPGPSWSSCVMAPEGHIVDFPSTARTALLLAADGASSAIVAVVDHDRSRTRLLRLSPRGDATPWADLDDAAVHLSHVRGRTLVTLRAGRVLEMMGSGESKTLFEAKQARQNGPNSAVALGERAIAVAYRSSIARVEHGKLAGVLARLPDPGGWIGMKVHSATDDGKTMAVEIWRTDGFTGNRSVRLLRCR